MSNDPSPLKSMGTQSRETMNMAEAMARRRGRDVAAGRSRVRGAAGWAMGKAKDGLHFAADRARARAETAVASYTRKDPIRAVLIAAGVGALLMGLVAATARSGVRTVRRKVRT